MWHWLIRFKNKSQDNSKLTCQAQDGVWMSFLELWALYSLVEYAIVIKSELFMDSTSQKDYELLLVLIILPEQWILAASAWQCHSVRAECLITKTRWRFNLEKQTEGPNWDLYKSRSSCYICCLFYLCCMSRFWFALEPEVMFLMWTSW